MKTIVPPHTPEPAPPWWVGKQAECKVCNATYQLEATDGPPRLSTRPYGLVINMHWVVARIECPSPGCGAQLEFRELCTLPTCTAPYGGGYEAYKAEQDESLLSKAKRLNQIDERLEAQRRTGGI